MLITMKHKWEVSPAEWVCKDEQQYSREEYQKQVDVKLCNKKRASCRPRNICQQPENQTCWLVLHSLRRGLMVYGVLSVGSILKHVFLLNRPMLIVVSLCRSRNKPWNQPQKLKRSSSCSFSSPSTVSTLNTFELHTLTCQKSLRQSTEFYQSDKFRGFKLHFQSNSTPSWTLSKYLKINISVLNMKFHTSGFSIVRVTYLNSRPRLPPCWCDGVCITEPVGLCHDIHLPIL